MRRGDERGRERGGGRVTRRGEGRKRGRGETRRGEEEGGRGRKVDERGSLIIAGFGRGGTQQGESDQPH